jgi:AraC-like DNA-binding protein
MSGAGANASSEAVVEMAIGQPAPRLRPLVERYVGYRLEGFAPGCHQGLPSRHVTLIVSLDRPVELAVMPDPRQSPGSFWTLVGGLHSAPATIRHDGRQHGVHLELSPLGTRALLGLPAGELASTVVHLQDLLGPRGQELPERLAGLADWPARFAVLDQFLAGMAADRAGPPAPVAWAWRRLVATGGGVEVAALAREAGWSRRHLGEAFRRELGISPKVAARVLRFERSCRLLRRRQRPRLAEVALASGYYDQAHLNREWRELAGRSPAAWLAEELPSAEEPPSPDESNDELPSVQDAAAGAEAS